MNKIYQMQVQITEEVFKMKQIEVWMQEISATVAEFKDITQDIAEFIKGILSWYVKNR